MKAQLNNPNSEFYFAYSDNDVAGYLKININDAQTDFIMALKIIYCYLFHK